MNEIANVCELFGADVDRVRQAVGLGSPHRLVVPVSRRRLRRQLLSEGRQGAGAVFGRQASTTSRCSRRSRPSTSGRSGCSCKKMEAHFESLKGKTIAIWGLAFKPKTDDMREAPAIPIVQSLLEKGAKVQVYDPEAMNVARGIFGSKVTYAPKSYDALRGADALAIVTEWHEFREPDFARMRKLMRTPGDLRRPQHLSAAADEGARLHLLLDRTVTRGAGPRHRRGGLHRQPRRARPARRRARASSCSTICRRGTQQAVPADVPLVRLRIHDRAAVAEALRRHEIDAVMHFAAWLYVADSVRDPLGYYANNVVGSLALLGAMVDAGVGAARVLVHLRRLRRAGDGADRRDRSTTRPINAYGETKLAVERALAHVERAARPALDRAALLQRGRRASRRHASARITIPEIHLIPRAIQAATGRRAAAGVRRGLSDAGRHLSARLHSRLRSGRRARAGARRRSKRGAASGGLQRRHRTAAFGAPGDRHGQPRRRGAGALDVGAAAARRPGRALRGERSPAARAGLAAAHTSISTHRPARLAVASDRTRAGYRTLQST